MADGNMYLIKLVKSKPLLWNKKLPSYRDFELKNLCWIEIAQQIAQDEKWTKKRWIYLRELFVKELRAKYICIKSKNTFIPNFKYYKYMGFLKKYIKFRHSRIYNMNDDAITDYELDIEKSDTDDSNDMYVFDWCDPVQKPYKKINYFDDIENETEEFTITLDDILDDHVDEDIDSDNIFVELSDTKMNSEDIVSDNMLDELSDTKINSEDIADNIFVELSDTKIISEECYNDNDDNDDDDKLIIADTEIEIKTTAETPNGNKDISEESKVTTNDTVHTNSDNKNILTSSKEERCEDAIFGELVTAMLKKMKTDKKKDIQKKIMNLLLE